jgi:hypothetical protein
VERPVIASTSRSRAERGTLADWIAVHGPLWPSEALVIVLDAVSRASRMRRAELACTIGSLGADRIETDSQGAWRWQPVSGQGSRASPDDEVLERAGAVLFHMLTGQATPYPHGGESALRASMRQRRPDIPPQIVDLTVDALVAGQGRMNLETFALRVRQAMGTGRSASHRRRWRPAPRLLAAALTVLAASIGWVVAGAPSGDVSVGGFIPAEIEALDATAETAETFALIDEHTASIQLYAHHAQLLRRRLGPEDPRLAWNSVHEAWVRTLAGDRLTTEQILEQAPARLIRHLGELHPFTRTARLGLAETLALRGALAEASALRIQAANATRDLLAGSDLDPGLVDPAPVPVGVLAHVEPNAPDREGFRRRADGRYGAPLTSTQRYMSEKNGWRLYLVTSSGCRASFATGNDARRVAVAATPQENRTWRIELQGTVPPIDVTVRPAGSLGLSVVADAAGALRVTIAGQPPITTAVDQASTTAAPPHTFVIDSSGCQVAWLEIIYPPDARFAPRAEM